MARAYALMTARERTDVVLLCAALLGARALTLGVVAQPGYTDAYYYAVVAERLAHGHGLTADFVWNFLEAPGGRELPVPSHRFWGPLATLVQALGIGTLGPLLGAFRAAQAPIVALAVVLPLAAYAAARALGAAHGAALVAGAIAGLGGAFAPGWVALDNFVPAALLGTAFFILYAHASRGSVTAGALAGLAVGLLYLARAEAALFGLALLALRSRAGLAGAAVALAIGIAWQLRQASLGYPADVLARTVLLLRYEEFFAVAPPTLERYLAAWPDALRAKLVALATNAVTLLFAFMLMLVPGLAAGGRALWHRASARAYVLVLATVYLVLSLVFTQHSTRGAFFHALAAFFPFGVALAVVGWGTLLASRRALGRVAALGAIGAAAALSAFAVAEWDRAFNVPYRARVAAVPAVPAGPFFAIDAAAWRWITGRSVIVTPADGDICTLPYRGAIVLEPAHFSVYDALYRAGTLTRVGEIAILGDPCAPATR